MSAAETNERIEKLSENFVTGYTIKLSCPERKFLSSIIVQEVFFCPIRRPCRDQMHEGGECFAVERKIVDCRFVLPLNDAFACLDSGLLIMGIM
jgi:hypothetical protein